MLTDSNGIPVEPQARLLARPQGFPTVPLYMVESACKIVRQQHSRRNQYECPTGMHAYCWALGVLVGLVEHAGRVTLRARFDPIYRAAVEQHDSARRAVELAQEILDAVAPLEVGRG